MPQPFSPIFFFWGSCLLLIVLFLLCLPHAGRWPDDIAAYYKTKAALGIQLANALTSACGARVDATEECLDVFWEGFVFRLLLFSDRDQAIQNQQTASVAAAAAIAAGAVGMSGIANGTSAAAAAGGHPHHGPHHHALSHAPPRVLQLSWHQGLVAGVEGQNAAFGPSVRLAKRWLGAQLLLGGHVREEVVELLMVAAFTQPSRTPPPGSRLAGVWGGGRMTGV